MLKTACECDKFEIVVIIKFEFFKIKRVNVLKFTSETKLRVAYPGVSLLTIKLACWGVLLPPPCFLSVFLLSRVD